MKKTISQFILSLGGQPSYSGKDKTMYIEDPAFTSKVMRESISSLIRTKFRKHEIPFQIKTS